MFSARNIIGSDASDTAFICYFFDKLFDSLNVSFEKKNAVKKILSIILFGQIA